MQEELQKKLDIDEKIIDIKSQVEKKSVELKESERIAGWTSPDRRANP